MEGQVWPRAVLANSCSTKLINFALTRRLLNSPNSHFNRGMECPSQAIHHESWEVTSTIASPWLLPVEKEWVLRWGQEESSPVPAPFRASSPLISVTTGLIFQTHIFSNRAQGFFSLCLALVFTSQLILTWGGEWYLHFPFRSSQFCAQGGCLLCSQLTLTQGHKTGRWRQHQHGPQLLPREVSLAGLQHLAQHLSNCLIPVCVLSHSVASDSLRPYGL